MSNQLGWVQFSKALDRRRAGARGAAGAVGATTNDRRA